MLEPSTKPPAAVPPCVRRKLEQAHVLASFVALATLTTASTASAQGSGEAKGEHTIVIWVEGGGPKDAEVRQVITSKLPSNVRVLDDAAFRKEMVMSGQKLPFKPLLGKGPFRKAALDRTRKALKALGAEGAILGNIRIGKGGQEVVVLYIEARDTGEDPDVETPVLLQGGNPASGIGSALNAPIEAWSHGAAKPAEPADEPKKKDEPDEEKEKDEPEEEKEKDQKKDEPSGDERPANLYGREIISLSAMFDLGGRWFSYTDAVTPNLRAYDVFGAPGFRLGAEIFPLATTDVVVLKDLGFTGGFGMALGLSSETQGGEEVSTSWMRVDAGLRLRLRTGSENAPVLGLHGGFSIDRFELETDDDALADEVPSVGYSFLRVGVDGRIPIGPVALGLFFDYLGAVSAGTVYDRFSGSSIGGIGLGGSFIVPIASGFEVRVGAEYDRWFYAFEPSVGDPFVAGGALDEYLHLTLGPAYVY